MTDDPDSPRVLVVDDAPDMRVVICRVLESHGYRVDTAGTLAEARAMTPGEYDAVLVDMRLGSEEGITLIEELAAANPGGAGRCLLMSGGLLPASSGVAVLAKPFLPDQLLDAVRALGRAEPAAAGSAGPEDGPGAPAPLAAAARESAALAGPAVPPFGLSDSLRARERASVADALHDGPVQDLASALLVLHLIRGQLPAAQAELVDSVARQVAEVGASLRGLIGRFSPSWLGEPPAEIIRNQTAWLLAAPPVVDIRPPAEGMSHKTAQLAADVAELALFLGSGCSGSEGQLPNASIRVLETEPALEIETTTCWAAGDHRDDASGSADTAWRESLRGQMESLLGADIDFAQCRGELQVRVSLRGTSGSRSA